MSCLTRICLLQRQNNDISKECKTYMTYWAPYLFCNKTREKCSIGFNTHILTQLSVYCKLNVCNHKLLVWNFVGQLCR